MPMIEPSEPPRPNRPRRAVRRSAALLSAVLCLVLFAASISACRPSPEEQAANREEIASFLREYLPKMAEAYRTGDTETLAPYAAKKEREAIKKRVLDLAKQGQVLAPHLDSLEVEDVRSWGSVNAYVTTVEVWDIKVLAAGSDTVLRQQLDQSNRVKYQLQRDGDRWRIFWRQLEQTFDN